MASIQDLLLVVLNLIFTCGVYYWVYSGFRKDHVKKYGEAETQRVVERDTGWNGNWMDYLRSIIAFILILFGIQYIVDLII